MCKRRVVPLGSECDGTSSEAHHWDHGGPPSCVHGPFPFLFKRTAPHGQCERQEMFPSERQTGTYGDLHSRARHGWGQPLATAGPNSGAVLRHHATEKKSRDLQQQSLRVLHCASVTCPTRKRCDSPSDIAHVSTDGVTELAWRQVTLPSCTLELVHTLLVPRFPD